MLPTFASQEMKHLGTAPQLAPKPPWPPRPPPTSQHPDGGGGAVPEPENPPRAAVPAEPTPMTPAVAAVAAKTTEQQPDEGPDNVGQGNAADGERPDGAVKQDEADVKTETVTDEKPGDSKGPEDVDNVDEKTEDQQKQEGKDTDQEMGPMAPGGGPFRRVSPTHSVKTIDPDAGRNRKKMRDMFLYSF